MQIDAGFIEKYDKAGPRYTSYPPAPHFSPDFDPHTWEELVKDSNRLQDQISFYFHIPFCPHRCLYCGCTVDIAAPSPVVKEYQAAILREMDLVMPWLDKSRKVSQIHFGGGTPNAVPGKYLAAILDKIRENLEFIDKPEVAIECDPNLLTLKRLDEYRAMGFTRVSFGLQDFKQDVLDNVERRFPKVPPIELISHARKIGFEGINLDLIYGLPGQSVESYKDTLAKTIEANPDRIAIFSYAHVPWIKPHQKPLEEKGLPKASVKNEIAVLCHNVLSDAGYVAIGMDHYAKPEDSLSVALKEKKLHRNFQGYCTRHTTGQVYGFGASSISQLHHGYGQNVKDTQPYIDLVKEGKLPLEKIYVMSEENIYFREVINSLMCRGELIPKELADKTGKKEAEVLAGLKEGMGQIQDYIDDGLVEKSGEDLKVTEKGWLVVRCIAMLFDPLLKENVAQYSRTV